VHESKLSCKLNLHEGYPVTGARKNNSIV